MLHAVLVDGPAWEPKSSERLRDWEHEQHGRTLVSAVKTKNNQKAPSRLGARQVRDFERIHSEGEQLSQEESTLFRALAARANYLSLDRPDT